MGSRERGGSVIIPVLQLQKRGTGIVKSSRSHKTACSSSGEWSQPLAAALSVPSAHTCVPTLPGWFTFSGIWGCSRVGVGGVSPREQVPGRCRMNCGIPACYCTAFAHMHAHTRVLFSPCPEKADLSKNSSWFEPFSG